MCVILHYLAATLKKQKIEENLNFSILPNIYIQTVIMLTYNQFFKNR